MTPWLRVVVALVGCLVAATALKSVHADDLACVSTTFRFIGANDKVCVSAFDDPNVPGVACHISQARNGRREGQLWPGGGPFTFFDRLPTGRADNG